MLRLTLPGLSAQTVVAGSLPACQTPAPGYAGVYDMSGNVAEWEDSCGDTMNVKDNCLVRGGSFTDSAFGLTCFAYNLQPRTTQDNHIGFRCCAP